MFGVFAAAAMWRKDFVEFHRNVGDNRYFFFLYARQSIRVSSVMIFFKNE